MTHKQWILVGSWLLLPALLALSFLLDPGAMLWIVAPFAVLALLNRDELAADYLAIPSVQEVFERSLAWKVIAIVYLALLLVAIGYHFGIARLSLFENANLATVVIGIFVPVLGPIVVAQKTAFRNLGRNRSNS